MEQRNGRVDRYGQVNVVEISYLYLADTRDEEILQRLREKLAEIARQLGSSSDVLGVGGQSQVIDALLEDLPLEELEARLERAAQQVRDYLSTSGASRCCVACRTKGKPRPTPPTPGSVPHGFCRISTSIGSW